MVASALALTFLLASASSSPDSVKRESLKDVGKEILSEAALSLHPAPSRLFYDVNPGCPLPACALNLTGSAVTLANFSVTVGVDEGQDPAPASNSETHWLWSVIGRPTLQVALTPAHTVARVDWAGLLGGGGRLDDSVSYSQRPDYSAAVTMANVSLASGTTLCRHRHVILIPASPLLISWAALARP